MFMRPMLCAVLCLLVPRVTLAEFEVDDTPPPAEHPALAPLEGASVAVNPPPLAWRDDARAASYELELAPGPDFQRDVIRVERIPYAFHTPDRVLAPGTWHWRYTVVTEAGERSRPGAVRSFVVRADAAPLPLARGDALMAKLAGHPRVFVTPATLEEFRARRDGVGRLAWEQIQLRADELLDLDAARPELTSLPSTLPTHRRQVFWVDPASGLASMPKNYGIVELNRDAERANLLSLAYLISGDGRYATAAREWLRVVVDFRVDYHLPTLEERGQHDTVVYAYERGLRGVALSYDRLYALLSPGEREAILRHVEFHGDAAMHWIRDVMKLHRDYQESHGQQCMHYLLATALGVAGESSKAAEWLAYMVPQYVSRIPWMASDGGYFEGQGYTFKLSYILEALAALRTATGLDLFQKPEIRNAGEFWLYGQPLNYWWPHWGDTMALVSPAGSVADAYIGGFLAAMTGNRALQWWTDAVPADPTTQPFGYLAATSVKPAPPVALAQARAFGPTGVVAAFDRFYDHASPRLFFRSSPWGGESHAHADQNSFVLHAGGEVFAADAGYYSYYGDKNYNEVFTQTVSHNSVLVDGRGQLNTFQGKGSLTSFFNAPDYTFMAGDASQAYAGALDGFRRDILFVRPDVVVIGDELHAPQAAEFTWLLNTFVAPEIRAESREFTVTQRAEKLWGQQVFPEGLTYTASNQRAAPLHTREWSRYLEAFPEQWKLKAVTPRGESSDILTVLHTARAEAGRRVTVKGAQRDAEASALDLVSADGRDRLLLRRRLAEAGVISLGGLSTDGRVGSVGRSTDGKSVVRWLAIEGTTLREDDTGWFSASHPISIAAGRPAAAQWQYTISAVQATAVSIPAVERPQSVMLAQTEQIEMATPLEFSWREGQVSFVVPEGLSLVFMNPRVPLASRPLHLMAGWHDGVTASELPLELDSAQNGDWTGFARTMPAVAGYYQVATSDPRMEIVVQDRWDEARSVRGHGTVRAFFTGGTELILRFGPAPTLPEVNVRLVESVLPAEVNLLRNGDCEIGLPGYPPRGWTVQNGGGSGTYAQDGGQGWPGWSQEEAASGASALKFTRPLNVIADWRPPYPVLARNQLAAKAPPVRLLARGRYRLACQTKGSSTTASVVLETSTGVRHSIPIAPSAEWTMRQLELELPAGFTQVSVLFREGGADDQVLWVDDVRLTRAPGRP